ncbi:uncharacterized protein TM35_000182440 [Trypanosoma theileri]|uniref:Uncharacterized protein n=1 Tax=Trypanosoma theileri TaxID=67003 RepID=A0A1X0NTZ2_9TRYP|nr:uncharacterized protein TM35_000182440 [Trypanosoma theileri]ORC88187.1 hypothetical protein TM35_000182440 [Trypanosoma theileri]
MELDSIKTRFTELQGYYEDESKSDDDIIYAVYNWVKSAHIVAQLLLLEGRFPELRRCLDLCRQVLQEQHPPANDRQVLKNATGEDRLLMDSLLVRTSQLERQYEEARAHSKGRDTEYYLNKLLHTDEETGRDGKENGQENVTPPERGISFGRRTRLNRWKVPPILPALVTQTQLFIRPTTDGFVDSMGDSHAKSLRSSYSLAGFRAETHPTYSHDITLGNNVDTSTIAILSSSYVPTPTVSSPPHPSAVSAIDDNDNDDDAAAAKEEEEEEGEKNDEPIDVFTPLSSISSSMIESQQLAALHNGKLKTGEEHLPSVPVKTSTHRKVHSKYGRLVRPLSARVDSTALPSGSLHHRLLMDADAHVIRSAIAIKTANEIRYQSMAFMQSLKNRASSLVQRTRSQRSTSLSTETWREEIEKEKNSGIESESPVLPPLSYCSSVSLNTMGQSVPSSKPFHQTVSSPLHGKEETIPPTSITGIIIEESEIKNMNSMTAGKHDTSLEPKEGIKEGISDTVPSNMYKLDEIAMIPSLSPQAKEELEEALSQYQQEKEKLDASSKAMHLRAKVQSEIFKLQEVNVKVEDTAVWKRRRKLHTALNDRATTSAASASEFRFNSPISALDSDTISNHAWAAVATPGTASTVSAKGGVETLLSDDQYAPTAERIAKLAAVRPTEWDSQEEEEEVLITSHPSGTHHPIDEKESTQRCFHNNNNNNNNNKSLGHTTTDMLTVRSTSGTTSSLMKGTDASFDAVEQRLKVLEASTHIAFPDVHHMVWKRAKVRVEQQRRLTNHEGILSMTSEKAFPSFFFNNQHNEEVSPPGKTDVAPIKKVWASLQRLRRESTYKMPLSVEDTNFMKEEEEEVKNTSDGIILPPQLFHSVEELRYHVHLDEADAVTLSMCLPLHLATVRIQRMCKLFIAKREKMRRSAAIQEHLRLLEIKEESAVVIQRYVRRLLARRQKLTIALRVSYMNDQRVAHEMISDETLTNDPVNSRRLTGGHLRWRSSDSAVTLHSPIQSFRRSPDLQQPLSSTSQGQQNVFSPLLPLFSRQLYCLPQKGNRAPSTRFVRLRRIQENIACRVIVRAFRAYRQRLILKWEREARACVAFVTQKMSSDEAFGSIMEDEVSFPAAFLDRTAAIGERLIIDSVFNDFGASSVFPLPRDRIMGDVVAAWEARTAKTRRAGDFMTPLEPVRLSELRRTLAEREEAAASLRRRQQELQLEEEEEWRRQLRVRMDAVLLLQRCARGYVVRSRLFAHLQSVQEVLETQHRRTELLGDVTYGMTTPRGGNNTSGRNLLHIASAKGKPIISEDHPIPPHVADVIEQGIKLRHSMWFGEDEESQRASLRAIVMIQSFLRWHISLSILADHQNSVYIILIQRRWRLVLKRREMLREKKQKYIVETLRKVGY